MADEAHNRLQPGGSHLQPLSIPAETPQCFSLSSGPCLSAAWLQPLVPTLVVQPTSRTAVTFHYLPPHSSLLQPPLRRDELPPIPPSMDLPPSIQGWGMTGGMPGPFVGPGSSEYCPVEQWRPHLQPGASHQRTKGIKGGHGQQQRPMFYCFPSAPIQQQAYQSTIHASQMTGVLGLPLESLEPTALPLGNPSSEQVIEVQATTHGLQVVDAPPDGGQCQDHSGLALEIPNRTKTCLCPATASVLLLSTRSPSEGPIEIIDLGASEDESSGTSGAQKPLSLGTVQSSQVMETEILSVSTGSSREEWKNRILNPAQTVQRDLETEKLPPKKRWRKRKMANSASPIQAKIKIHIPDPQILQPEKDLDVKVCGSRCKGLQMDKKNTQPKKAQATKITNVKNKMQAKPSTEPSKRVPRSDLALRLMESVQVFHPLGKRNVPTVPARRAPPSSSSTILPVKPLPAPARPPPKAVPKPVPKPLQNPRASALAKAVPPASLPKPPPSSVAKPSRIPALVPQPVMPKPQPTSLKGTLPRLVGRTSTLPLRHGISRREHQGPSHSQAKGPIRPILNFCPRTLPRDHGLLLRYPPPPPVLPFELAFRNWKPPPRDLEVSRPINEEQRPRREMMKRQAQKEREEAAWWTSLGRVQFFVERKKEKDISVMFGYP